MNKYTPILILVLFLGITNLQAQQQAFSLRECLDYAYQNNETLKNSALDQSIAKTDVGVTKADGLPQINGTIGYTNNFAVQTAFLPAVFFADDPNNVPADAPPVPVRFGVQHSGNAAVTLTQMLFDGSYFVGLKAANTYTELMRKNFNQSKTDITEQVTKAYYTVLVNQERANLLSSNYNRLDSLLNETRLMYENGLAEKIDADRIAVQYNNAKTAKAKNERAVQVSYLLLKFQMGMPVEENIELADQISDIDLNFNIDEGGDFKYTDRIDYSSSQINRELTELDLRNNRVQYLPKLSANGTYGYNAGLDQFSEITNFNNQWFKYAFAGVTLDIPIFDGLRKSNRIQKNKLQIQQLENQTRQLKNSIDVEIVQAKVNLQDNVEALNIQQENLDLAQEVFDVTKIKYQQGVGSNLEVITAEDDLQTAETNYFSALYDALIAKVDLNKALGKLIEE